MVTLKDIIRIKNTGLSQKFIEQSQPKKEIWKGAIAEQTKPPIQQQQYRRYYEGYNGTILAASTSTPLNIQFSNPSIIKELKIMLTRDTEIGLSDLIKIEVDENKILEIDLWSIYAVWATPEIKSLSSSDETEIALTTTETGEYDAGDYDSTGTISKAYIKSKVIGMDYMKSVISGDLLALNIKLNLDTYASKELKVTLTNSDPGENLAAIFCLVTDRPVEAKYSPSMINY